MPKDDWKFQMQDRVHDAISGFAGVVIARTEYLNGCIQYLLAGPSKDGAPGKDSWFDEQVLVLDKSSEPRKRTKPTGGPSTSSPPSMQSRI